MINRLDNKNHITFHNISNEHRNHANEVKAYRGILKLHNPHHLGDQVFNIFYFNKISNYLEANQIFIIYYMPNEYINQVSEFIKFKNIKLLPLENTASSGINLWIGNSNLTYNSNLYEFKMIPFNIFYVKFFNMFSYSLGIPRVIKTLAYEDDDLLIRYDALNEKYKNIDLLIVNSNPLSGQIHYNENDWNNLVRMFSKKYNIVITKKVDDIKCTLDDNLSIKDVGAISTKVKVIIAVNTGVITALLNVYTLKNVRAFYTLDQYNYYNFKNFACYKKLTDLPIKQIFYLLDEIKNNEKL